MQEQKEEMGEGGAVEGGRNIGEDDLGKKEEGTSYP